MDVVIQESSSSPVVSYGILVNDEEAYVVLKKFWTLQPKLFIYTPGYQYEDKKPCALIRKIDLGSRYEFKFLKDPDYKFRRTSLLNQTHVCEGGGQRFIYYQHRKLRGSIFHNDHQIAAISKNRIVYSTGNRYEIKMNSDADLLLISCMVLAINTTRGIGSGGLSTITFDLGNLIWETRPVDESWEPL